MQININRRIIYNAVNELSKVADSKSSLPIMRHVHLHAKDGLLTLTASDTTHRLSCLLPADGELDTCLPAKMFAKVLKPEGNGQYEEALIEIDEHDRAVIHLSEGTTRLPTMNSAKYPSENSQDKEWGPLGTVSSNLLRDALGFVLPAASKDPTRPHLNTVYWDNEQMATTDGHRLHLAPLASSINAPMLIPISSATTLLRLLSLGQQVSISGGKDRIHIFIDCWKIDTKLINAKFPPFHQIIPDRNSIKTQITVKNSIFAKAITRLKNLSEEKGAIVQVNGKMVLKTYDAENGEAEIIVPTLRNNHQGEEFATGFNSRYLQDAIDTEGEVVELGFSGKLDPLRVDCEGRKVAVVMPMRV